MLLGVSLRRIRSSVPEIGWLELNIPAFLFALFVRGIRVDLAVSSTLKGWLIVVSFRALFVTLEASAFQSKFFSFSYFNGRLEINFTYLPHHVHH